MIHNNTKSDETDFPSRKRWLPYLLRFVLIFSFVFTILCVKHFLSNVDDDYLLIVNSNNTSEVSTLDEKLYMGTNWDWAYRAALFGLLVTAAGLIVGMYLKRHRSI